MQNTKRSLWTSVTALLLCFVMLIGTTFAWFTDEVSSANNIIKAGTLDIAMSWSADNANWKDTEGANAKPVFDYDNWEPGYTEVRYIKVHNLGNLAFQYKMAINPTGAVGKLAEVIDVSFDIVTDNASFVAPTADNKQGSLVKVATLADLIAADGIVAGGVLLPDGTEEAGYYDGEIVICISFHMQETAGNEYQGLSIGDAFGINLYATQFDYEKDSFDNSYDDDAAWPNVENGSASANIDASNLLHGALINEVVINGDGISATIPADVKVADGATSLDLTVESATADANISLGDGASATGFNVHIEGIAQDNTKPMIVNLGAILNPALSETELKLYHTENGTPTLMTRVDSAADFAIHNQYTYDPATGEVSIYVASFSVFSAVKTSADVWDGEAVATGFASGTGTENDPYIINTAAQLVYFRNQVDEGVTYEGEFVKLDADINLECYDAEGNRVSFNPISYGYYSNTKKSFMGTFDGGKHTIYGLYQNGWDLEAKYPGEDYTTSTAGGGLFASVLNATIKNLAVSGANITMECVDMGVVVGYAQGNCTFENIIVTDSKIANYQRYAGGVVGEVCKGDMSKEYTHIFRNVIVDSSVVVSSLWGDFDNACGGVIGGKWGDAKVLMEDVTVAARIDAFSDVTAAYQWYAYRRCGMLIGHTEQNSPKSALNAAADFLTCNNVNVYYGDWINYTYYQFAEQTDEHGNKLWYSNYPWVRAQAGENNGALSNVRYGNAVIKGQKINTIELAEANYSDKVTITFNQLYGGGQGVYGKAEHAGVTTNSKEFKTVYVNNTADWTNLKLQYWFANGNDTWTTIVDGIDMSTMLVQEGVYKIQLPTTAYAFKIVADGEESDEFILSTLEHNSNVYTGSAPCAHTSTTIVVENKVASSCTEKGSYDNVTKCVDCGVELSRETVTVAALGHKYDNACDTTCNTCGATRTVGDHNWYNASYTCTICGKNAGTNTVYFKNNWNWSDIRIYYWYSQNGKEVNNSWRGESMNKYANDGFDIYSFELPGYVDGIIVSGFKDDGSGTVQQTDNILSSNIADGKVYSVNYHSNLENHVTVNTTTIEKLSLSYKYNKIYLTPNANWKSDNARFAAYVWDAKGDAWFSMLKESGDLYYCFIPDKYTNIIFCRMTPSDSTNNWNNKWNQTGNLTIANEEYHFTLKSGSWDAGSWSIKE